MLDLINLATEATTIGSQLNDALEDSITGSTIMGEFIDILPWVGIMVGVGFLIYEARKLLKGAQKGKARV